MKPTFENCVDVVTQQLEKQAKEDLEFWKKAQPLVARIMIEAEIRDPKIAKAMTLLWTKGYCAGYVRAVGLSAEE